MAASWYPSLIPLFLSVTLVACGEKSAPHTADSAAASSDDTARTNSAAVIPDSVWIAKGLPDPNRTWNDQDMEQAYSVLQKSPDGMLPHYDPTGKEKAFARIASAENLAVINNNSIPVVERVQSGTGLLKSYTQIYFLYAGLAMNGDGYKEEITELMITILKGEEAFAVLMTDFIKTVPKERQESEQFQGGLRQIREGITQSLGGTITVLRDKEIFTTAQLEKIADALKETAPQMLPFLDDELMGRLHSQAEQTIAETENAKVKSVLQELFFAE